MTLDLHALRRAAEQAAYAAGQAAMRTFGSAHDETTKSGIYDIVTEGDRASEAAILPILRAHSPYPILSEEGGGEEFESPYAWHLDPIDGTTNYANNLPHFSVSIALADRDLVPLVGVVLNPVTGELFSAARGHGATLNGRPIHVSPSAHLNQCVVATGFPTGKRTLTDNNIDAFIAVLPRVRDVRRFGSAALDLAFVAAGRFEAFWESNIHSWDVLAGLLLVTEAGGRVSDYDENTTHLYTGAQVMATNGHIHDALLLTVNNARR